MTEPLTKGRILGGELVLRAGTQEYVLGEVSAEYEAKYPRARERIIRMFVL